MTKLIKSCGAVTLLIAACLLFYARFSYALRPVDDDTPDYVERGCGCDLGRGSGSAGSAVAAQDLRGSIGCSESEGKAVEERSNQQWDVDRMKTVVCDVAASAKKYPKSSQVI